MADKPEQDKRLPDLMNIAAQREEFLETFFRKGAELTEELFDEIESLRDQVKGLQEENAAMRLQLASDDAIRDLLNKIRDLEEEKLTLKSHVDSVNEKSMDYMDRYSEVERELDAMANLYVASFQLHGTMQPEGVLSVLEQMLMQFVGASSFALYLRRKGEKRDQLVPVHAFHCDEVRGTVVDWNQGLIGEAAANQVSHVGDPSSVRASGEPLACIPMVMGEETVGVIAIYDLLEQKSEFVNIDFELFKLLGIHSASAIVGAGLLAEAGEMSAGLNGYKRL